MSAWRTQGDKIPGDPDLPPPRTYARWLLDQQRDARAEKAREPDRDEDELE